MTDEDPAKTDESKLASWTYTSRGGFYWAGAYACKDFVLVGTDDGEAGYTTAMPACSRSTRAAAVCSAS